MKTKHITLIAFVAILLIAIFTNPSQEEHKEKVKETFTAYYQKSLKENQTDSENAFTALGNRTDVKIISMSMGHIFSVGKIEDGVRYANNRGKLIFCAGGTSTSFTNFVGVIFPAWMPETVAVTGIKEASTYQKI
mgnify:CR=1 FL=1